MAENNSLGRPGAVEIKIGNVPLAWKLSAVDAALQAIQEAHRDTMQTPCWAAISRARENLAAAVFEAGKYRDPLQKELPKP